MNTLSNTKISIDHICPIPYRDGDLDVAVRWTLTGVHGKVSTFGAPYHKDLLILGCKYWRFIEDKIAEEWTVFADLVVLRQVYTKI